LAISAIDYTKQNPEESPFPPLMDMQILLLGHTRNFIILSCPWNNRLATLLTIYCTTSITTKSFHFVHCYWLLEDYAYDLVVLDVKMPDLNGFALYREIKRFNKRENREEPLLLWVLRPLIYYTTDIIPNHVLPFRAGSRCKISSLVHF